MAKETDPDGIKVRYTGPLQTATVFADGVHIVFDGEPVIVTEGAAVELLSHPKTFAPVGKEAKAWHAKQDNESSEDK